MNIKRFKLRKLGSEGFSHHFLIALIVFFVAVCGTYIVVKSRADSTQPVTCSINGPATIYNNVAYKPTYTITNNTSTNIFIPKINISIYKGFYHIGQTPEYSLTENSPSIPAIAPGISYAGNLGSYAPTNVSSPTDGTAVFTYETNSSSQGSSTSATGLFCDRTFNIVGSYYQVTLNDKDWNLNNNLTKADDGAFRNLIKLSPPANGSTISGDNRTQVMAIDSNGLSANACLTARAIEPATTAPQTLNFRINNVVNNRSLGNFVFSPAFDHVYQKYCWSFILPKFNGAVPTSGPLDPSKFGFTLSTTNNTYFFIRGITITLN